MHAKNDPEPSPEELYTHVYSQPPPGFQVRGCDPFTYYDTKWSTGRRRFPRTALTEWMIFSVTLKALSVWAGLGRFVFSSVFCDCRCCITAVLLLFCCYCRTRLYCWCLLIVYTQTHTLHSGTSHCCTTARSTCLECLFWSCRTLLYKTTKLLQFTWWCYSYETSCFQI